MIKEATLQDRLLEGGILMQHDNPAEAYLVFKEVALNDEATPQQRCTAYQQMGVCARIMGDLKDARAQLEHALALTKEYEFDRALTGAVLRDLAAVYGAIYHSYHEGFRGYEQEQAEKHLALARTTYNESLEVLSQGGPMHELISTKIFKEFLEWQAADYAKGAVARKLRKERMLELSHQLSLSYGDLVFYIAGHASTDTQPQVYQVNALIRLVRTLPFAKRMKFRRDLLRLTTKDSPSPGTRKRALVALITGNAVYGRVELLRAQRSR